MNSNVIVLGAGFDFNMNKDNEEKKSMVETLLQIKFQKALENRNKIKEKYLGICECAQYGIYAANMAWEKTTGKRVTVNPEKWSVMTGTAIGESSSLYANQCKVLVEQGPMWLMPSIVTNKGPKTTADVFSIEKKLMGGSITFESGRNSSGMAVLHAFDEICNGRLDGAVVIGTEYIDSFLTEALEILNYDYTYYRSGACGLVLASEEQLNSNDIINNQVRLLAVETVGGTGKPYDCFLIRTL